MVTADARLKSSKLQAVERRGDSVKQTGVAEAGKRPWLGGLKALKQALLKVQLWRIPSERKKAAETGSRFKGQSWNKSKNFVVGAGRTRKYLWNSGERVFSKFWGIEKILEVERMVYRRKGRKEGEK